MRQLTKLYKFTLKTNHKRTAELVKIRFFVQNDLYNRPISNSGIIRSNVLKKCSVRLITVYDLRHARLLALKPFIFNNKNIKDPINPI